MREPDLQLQEPSEVSIASANSTRFLKTSSNYSLILDFVNSISSDGAVDTQWQQYIAAKKDAELSQIISEENLKEAKTRDYIQRAFADGELATIGTAISTIMPSTRRFGPGAGAGAGYIEKRRRIIERLSAYFERFRGLGVQNEHD